MAVRKIKGSWWVDFRTNHQRIRKRSPDNTKAGAEAYEAVLRQKVARGEPIGGQQRQPKDQTFAQFAPKWCEDYVKPNNKYSEQLAKKYILSSSLIPFFGPMLIGQIRAHDIERYKAHQVQHGFTNKTIMNRLTVLNKCLGTAYEWLELDGAPPKIKWPRWQSPEIDYLSPDECEVLLAHAEGNSCDNAPANAATRPASACECERHSTGECCCARGSCGFGR
jgi:Phage integrase, N-terminal SAM-like domain